MSIRDEIRAAQDSKRQAATLSRCNTCTALAGIGGPDAIELRDIMTDDSFQDTAIADWLTKAGGSPVSHYSVANHRRGSTRHEHQGRDLQGAAG